MSDHSKQTPNHTSSYAILPSFIMDDENLEEGAKILYARISMYSQEGRCWASNAHFADKQKVTTRCVQKWLKQLVDNGYIEVEIETGGFQTKRNIWIIIDFKKNFTKRTTVHPPQNYSSPPPESQFVHTMSKQDNENIDKDNVLIDDPPDPQKIPKQKSKTMPLSKDKKGTLDAKRRWKLSEEQYQDLLLLQDSGVDTEENTLVHWVLRYPSSRITEVLKYAKSRNPKSIGAYMHKLLRDKTVIQDQIAIDNASFAEEYRVIHQWTQMKIGKKFVTIPYGVDKIEIPLSLSSEEFVKMLMEKHDIYLRRG